MMSARRFVLTSMICVSTVAAADASTWPATLEPQLVNCLSSDGDIAVAFDVQGPVVVDGTAVDARLDHDGTLNVWTRQAGIFGANAVYALDDGRDVLIVRATYDAQVTVGDEDAVTAMRDAESVLYLDQDEGTLHGTLFLPDAPMDGEWDLGREVRFSRDAFVCRF